MIHNKISYSSNYRIKVSKAEGSFIFDDKGKRYIDFTSGWNVTNLGWNHPEVNEAVSIQAKKNVYAPLWGSDDAQEAYAEALTAALPKELNTCCKATGGTEALEEAIKIARGATGRKKIIGFEETYHGQLFAGLALGHRAEWVDKISPLVPEFIQLQYPRGEELLAKFLETLEKLLAKKDVAAVVTEPGMVTGWGSVLVAPLGYLAAVRSLTKKYSTLLIVDEVGTGFSRTGKLFAIEYENVVPDLIVLAKAISNGAGAIGAVVGKKAIIEEALPHIHLISTFGWTPIACAAAAKTLEVHRRDNTAQQAYEKGEYLKKILREKLNWSGKVVDIRGMGLEIGLQLAGGVRYGDIADRAAKNGLHLTGDDQSLFQLMPALTIPQTTLTEGAEILINAILT